MGSCGPWGGGDRDGRRWKGLRVGSGILLLRRNNIAVWMLRAQAAVLGGARAEGGRADDALGQVRGMVRAGGIGYQDRG